MEKYYYDADEKLLKAGDPQTIEQAKREGAHGINVPALTQAQTKIDREIDDYKRMRKKIEADKDPRMTDEVKAYELKRLESEFDSKVSALEREYLEERSKAIEDAHRLAARATESISPVAEMYAQQKYSRLASEVMANVTADGQRQALRQFREVLKQFSDAEKVAIQPLLIGITVHNDAEEDFRKVLREANQLDNFAYVAPDAIEQLPLVPSTKLVTFRAVRRRKY